MAPSVASLSDPAVNGALREGGQPPSRTTIGPTCRTAGAHIAGAAVTLQFMPRREDVVSGSDEDAEKHSALWAVFDDIQPGDVLVVQAYGDVHTGCLGEMLLASLQGLGGVGAVVDGSIRDWPEVAKLGIPVWSRGVTPNFASQASLFPWAYDVPIACSGVLVLPGDVVIADADGVVVVPRTLAPTVLEASRERQDWEEGEWLSTRYEFDALIETGIAVLQPDIGRVGGVTEARRICDRAAIAGRLVVPHAWKTGISVALAAHLAMVTPHMPFFEFLPQGLCESRLRKELTFDELVLDGGVLRPPSRPGLGVEICAEALEEFAAAARRLAP